MNDTPEKKPDDTESFRIPLIGLLVERKTNLLAAAAFVMALIAAVSQFYYFWVGARVTFFPPEQVVLVMHELPDGRKIFRIGARMAYVNTGRPGYNATLRRESVSFSLGGKTYDYGWQSERRFSEDGGELKSQYVAEARPIPIGAGSSVSREIFFAPWPERCRPGQANCDRDGQFIFDTDAIHHLWALKTLRLTFSGVLYGETDPMSAACTVDITPAVLTGLTREGWAAPPCWP